MLGPRRLLIALALTCATLAPSGPPADAAAPGGRVERYTVGVLQETNAVRAEHGRTRLRHSDCLARFARAQARRMAGRGAIFHQALGPVQAGCAMGWVGENVAFGYRSTSALVGAWMRSPGHRHNLLFGAYRQIGVGAVHRGGTWYVVQLFGETA